MARYLKKESLLNSNGELDVDKLVNCLDWLASAVNLNLRNTNLRISNLVREIENLRNVREEVNKNKSNTADNK